MSITLSYSASERNLCRHPCLLAVGFDSRFGDGDGLSHGQRIVTSGAGDRPVGDQVARAQGGADDAHAETGAGAVGGVGDAVGAAHVLEGRRPTPRPTAGLQAVERLLSRIESLFGLRRREQWVPRLGSQSRWKWLVSGLDVGFVLVVVIGQREELGHDFGRRRVGGAEQSLSAERRSLYLRMHAV